MGLFVVHNCSYLLLGAEAYTQPSLGESWGVPGQVFSPSQRLKVMHAHTHRVSLGLPKTTTEHAQFLDCGINLEFPTHI